MWNSLLIAVVYIIAGAGLAAGAQKPPSHPQNTTSEQEPLPEYVVYDVTHYHYQNGHLRVEIRFDRGEFYSEDNQLHVENCNFVYYDINGNVLSRGSSKRAVLFRKNSVLIARKDVKVVSEVNQATLETQYLRWSGETNQYTTDEFVTITRKNGDWVSGVGMVADVALEYVAIKKDVRGSFMPD
ncbi:MAG: LPS export ABC transporter periplasmic protein LptC [Spirochaetota bacterium]